MPVSSTRSHKRRLIDSKTEVQYAATILTETRARDLLKAAHRLVDGMDQILRSA
ncbi:hypothetical protein GCM10009747_16910 [Agromyces humatus]|uniref:Uncharacterized protein n=1 Tax=Agromyces humatus TaxID=279573 RepID=A0ABP4WNA5_9MICO